MAESPFDGAVGYCLRCYAPIQRFRAPSVRCARCDFINTREDQREFWTRSPVLMLLERAIKAAILLFTIVLASIGFHASSGPGSGWLVTVPIAVNLVLWQTAGLLTRRRAILPMSPVWMTTFSILGLDAFVIAFAFDLHPLWTFGAACLVAVFLVPVTTVAFHRWKVGCIVRGAG